MASKSAVTTYRSEIPKIFNFPHDLRAMARKGWVVPLLEQHGNCALPDDLLLLLGSATTARLLTVIMGEDIAVYESNGIWIAKR